MEVCEVKKKFCEYFESKKHKIIPSASLVPEIGDEVLFTTAGMHPLIRYLAGRPCPYGKRVANVQKVIRTGMIDCVGEDSFCTFFELLGNWSLGDYHRMDAIAFAWDFLTSPSYMGIDKEKIAVTCFSKNALYDECRETYDQWISIGIERNRIWESSLNWKGPYSEYHLCGPNTKIFYDTGAQKCSDKCSPLCKCGKYVEIWDIVFLDYCLSGDKLIDLPHKNVDTGMGVERLSAITEGVNSVYETGIFVKIIEFIKAIPGIDYTRIEEKSIRIIADHIRCIIFVLGDNERVLPASNGRGYVLRKIIRRVLNISYKISLNKQGILRIAQYIIDIYGDEYPELCANKGHVFETLSEEIDKYGVVIDKGIKQLKKITEKESTYISKKCLDKFRETYGLPYEIIESVIEQSGLIMIN